MNALPTGSYRARHAADLAATRSALNEGPFRRAWQAGRNLSREGAIDLAIDDG